MRRRELILLALAVLLIGSSIVGLVALRPPPPPAASIPASTPGPTAPPLPSVAWRLTSLVVDGKALALSKGSPTTLVFEGSSARGESVCNSYGGTVAFGGDGFSFGNMIKSEVGCGDVEVAYFAGLLRLDHLAVDGLALHLTGDGVDMRFEALGPQPIGDVHDRDWTLVSAQGPDGEVAVVGLPTLVLRADGGIAFDTGCFRREGQVVVLPDLIAVTQLNGVESCGAPRPHDVLMARAIGRFQIAVVGGRLILRGGGAVLTFQEA